MQVCASGAMRHLPDLNKPRLGGNAGLTALKCGAH
jgi:hypothetical protein